MQLSQQKQRRAMKKTITLTIILLTSLTVFAESLPSSAILQTVKQTVYEVVIPKPENDPLTYEKPLPLDLLPFKVRNDKYFPVGSAFAINDSLLVTAAHVLRLHLHTQYGPHKLRDAAGNVYEIKNIVAYSSYRDAVLFTIDRKGPLKKLPVSRTFTIDQTVYAVGNALGEGVVIRDGLLTSTYPEAEEGLYELLRFSAAASPGNSGGPLLNKKGEVIGMVTQKSSNENLNYAVPMSEVLSILKKPGELKIKLIYGLPNCNFQKVGTCRGSIKLPATQQQCRQELSAMYIAGCRAMLDSILIENRDKYFPNGPNSHNVLYSNQTTTFPYLIGQANDGTWTSFGPKETSTSDLGDNGKLYVASGMFGYEFFQLDSPDSIQVSRYLEDGRFLMDNLLKGVTFNRSIGSSKTRIISLGAPVESGERTDSYGRKWLVRTWIIPYTDEKVMLFALPVPMGLVGFLRAYDLGMFDSGIVPDMEYMLDYLTISYYGTMKRWAQFTAMSSALPAIFRDIGFSYTAGKTIAVRTPRLAINYTLGVFAISDNSDLQFKFNYFPDNGRMVWDISGFLIGEDKLNNNYATVIRYINPPGTVSEGIKDTWQEIVSGNFPFNGTASFSNDKTFISDLHPKYKKAKTSPGSMPFLYTTSVIMEGKIKDRVIEAKLKALNKSVIISE
jgi:hypothetical protein